MMGTSIESWGQTMSAIAVKVSDVHPALLPAGALYCSFVALLAFLAWGRTSRKRRELARELAAMTAIRDELEKKLEAELKWRTASQRFDAQPAAGSSVTTASAPTAAHKQPPSPALSASWNARAVAPPNPVVGEPQQ